MTRPSASGRRFLVRRSDCGKFPDWRHLPADVAFADQGRGRESGVVVTLADVNDVLWRCPRGASLQEIREAAREMEAEEVRRMLKSGESSPLDCLPTVMEEIELDPNAPGGGRIVSRQEIPGE